MRMGDAGAVINNEASSTGSLSLDIALGIGGLPRGRVVEIYGPESSVKTTLTLQEIAEVQKLGGTAAFVDAEHAHDPKYARKLGVNVDDLQVSPPATGEQAGLVDKSGAWYSYNGTRIGQGKDNARTYLKEHPSVAREIEDQIRAKSLTLRPAGTEQSEEPAEAELD